MLAIENASDDTRTEGTRGIQTSTRVVHTDEFSDEEREADADGCDERR